MLAVRMHSSGDSSSDEQYIDEEETFGYFSPFQLSWMSIRLSKQETARVKKQLKYRLRIGSSLDIGEKQPIQPHTTAGKKRGPNGSDPEIPTQSTTSVHIMPTSLLIAREHGGCEPSMRSSRQRNFLANHYTDVNNGARLRWPAVQSFQNHIQGNLVSVSSFRLKSVHKQHVACVNALNFNSTGHLIASGSDDLSVVVTNVHTGELMTRFQSGHRLNVFQVKFVPESQDLHVTTAARDGAVRFAVLHPDGRSAATTRKIAKHLGACHKIAFCADNNPGAVLLTAGEDGSVYSIDLREKSQPTKVFDRRRMPPGAGGPTAAAKAGHLLSFSPHHISTLRTRRVKPPRRRRPRDDTDEEEEETKARETEDGEEADDDDGDWGDLEAPRGRRGYLSSLSMQGVDFQPHLDPLDDHVESRYSVTSAVYSAQGDAILASYNDEDIYLFNSQDDTLPHLHVYRGHKNNDTVKAVNFYGPNSEYVVSGSDDGFVYIWDRHSEGIVQWLYADSNGAVNVLEPHPTLPMLATSGCDYHFKIWTPGPSRNIDISRPQAWLQTVSNTDGVYTDLFDTERAVDSMNALRRSRLSRTIFGEDFDFSTPAKHPRRSAAASSDEGRLEQNSIIAAEAPQGRLPFNSKDLQLSFDTANMDRLLPALQVLLGDSPTTFDDDGNQWTVSVGGVLNETDDEDGDDGDDDDDDLHLGEVPAQVWRTRIDSAGTGISAPVSGDEAGRNDDAETSSSSSSSSSITTSSSSSSSTVSSGSDEDESSPSTLPQNNRDSTLGDQMLG